MIEFLNNYSALIVAFLFALITFLEKKSGKKAKQENEQRLKEAKEAEAAKEQLLAIQKEEQARKDENLNKTLKRMDGNIAQLSGQVSTIQEGLETLKSDFGDFKEEASNKFDTLGENCFLAMKYVRGVATLSLDLTRKIADSDDQVTRLISPQIAKLAELCESQEEHFLEGMFKGTIKK